MAKKFTTSAFKPVVISGQKDLVKAGFLEDRERAPRVLRPAVGDVDLAGWIRDHGPVIDRELARWGAVLFRDFQVSGAAGFEKLAETYCPDLFAEYGDLPSEEEGNKIYRSTPYPPDKVILFHNESPHMHRWPMKQWFYCVTAAAERGETPIVDCRAVYRELASEIRRPFAEKGLLYVRNFISGLDVSWRDFFRTGERAAVEDYCRSSGFERQWLPDEGLRISQRAPAVARHPVTGELVFFNQVQLHHASFLEPEVRESLLALVGEDGLPRNVYYGDGSPVPDDVMREIEKLYWRLAVQFRWQEGDILLVDNMIMAHARNPYSGERKILVAMGDMLDKKALAA